MQRRIIRNSALIGLLICLISTAVMAQKTVPTKIIYFMAGTKDHAGPSRHETQKDLLVLQHCIDSITNITGVKIETRFIYERQALDIKDMKDVAAIVIESSSEGSSRTRTHPLFPPSGDNTRSYDREVVGYLNQVDSLHNAGMGIIVLHWAADASNQKAASLYRDWFGYQFIPRYSHNPLGKWTITPIQSAKSHPILRGVGPWTVKDEVFSRFMVIPEDPNRTDLLMGEAPKTNQGTVVPGCITWAYEKGLGRGLVYGGMDYHSALLDDNYRRFLMNAIVWAAGIEVPKGGVKSAAKELQLVAAVPDQFDKM